MARHYPPLNALLVFLTSARTLSFTLAADELFVTRSAVSRQVKSLEDYLGVQLFHRSKSGLELTEKGIQYSNELSLIFAELKAATNAITGHEDDSKLKLGVSATFNATWLMSRLHNFYEQYPNIAIAFLTNNYDTGNESVDFSSDKIEAAIRLGHGDWEGVQCDKLFDIYVQPVCAPSLLEKAGGHMSISDLANFNWLGYKHLPDLWHQWLAAAGDAKIYTEKKEIELDSVAVAVQAAVDGLGIIPMYRPLADPLLKSGQLVVANNYMMKKPNAYYFVCPNNYSEHKPTQEFRQWVLNEAQDFERQWTLDHLKKGHTN